MNKFDLAITEAFQKQREVEGDNFIIYPRHETTMKAIEAAVENYKPDRFLAVALEQTKGVGSTDKAGHTRSWWSPTSDEKNHEVLTLNDLNLSFSQLFYPRPHEHPQNYELLALQTVGEIIRSYVGLDKHKVELAYPNGVLVDGKKISGILGRYAIDKGSVQKVNLGVGINVHKTPPSLVAHEGADVRDFTSLKELGVETSLGKVLDLFQRRFSLNLAYYRSHPTFEPSLAYMGFADPDTYHLKATLKATGAEITGRYVAFRTDENQTNIMILRTDKNEVVEHAVRDLRMKARAPHGVTLDV